MKIPYELIPTVQLPDIEDALEQNGIEIDDLRNFFWPEDFMNDCYKSVYFAKDISPDWGIYNYELMNKVYGILRKAFPGYSVILVDVSW